MAAMLPALTLSCSVGTANDQERKHGESVCENCQPDPTSPPPSEVVDIGAEYRVPVVVSEDEDSLPCTSQALGQAAGMAVPQHAGAIDCLLCTKGMLQAFDYGSTASEVLPSDQCLMSNCTRLVPFCRCR